MAAVTIAFPAGWSTRRPTLADVPVILEICHASELAAIGTPDFTADDVREALTAPNTDPQRDAWLAVDPSGRPAGWAYLENLQRTDTEYLEIYTHPELGLPAQAPLLDLLLHRSAERAAEWGLTGVTLKAGLIASETAYARVLTDAGFHFTKRYARMTRPLTGDEKPPQLPDGVTIRLVRPDDDADMRTFHRILDSAFRDTPDYTGSTYEGYRERLAALPSITWDEWFIAEVDGVPAGILQSADQSLENNEGWIKNLGVLREYRGRGLAALLLHTAFATYAAKGRTTAGLGVDLTNPTGAYRLYTAVGMRAAYESDVYARPL